MTDGTTLAEIFCMKLDMELGYYKRRIRKGPSSVIPARTEQIEAMACICEELKKKSRCMTEDAVRLLLILPDVLALFYRKRNRKEKTVDWEASTDATLEFLSKVWQEANRQEMSVDAA